MRDGTKGSISIAGWGVGAARTAGALLLVVALAGCTGARVTGLASNRTGAPAPSEILVDVSVGPGVPAAATAHRVAGTLAGDLVGRLAAAHVVAEPYVAGTVHPGAATLRVTVTGADPGNAAARFLIGFGAGRRDAAILQHRYDIAYTQCMVADGETIERPAPPRVTYLAPPSPPVVYVPAPVYVPPPAAGVVVRVR